MSRKCIASVAAVVACSVTVGWISTPPISPGLRAEEAIAPPRGIRVALDPGPPPKDLDRDYLDFPWVPTALYDPADPGLSFTLWLRNKSAQAVPVPRAFDGKALRFYGCRDDGNKVWLVPTARVDPRDTVQIPAGKTRVVFSLPMKEVLADRIDGGVKPAGRWDWTWGMRRLPAPVPLPPPREGAGECAVFWAELDVGSQTLRTEPMLVKRKK